MGGKNDCDLTGEVDNSNKKGDEKIGETMGIEGTAPINAKFAGTSKNGDEELDCAEEKDLGVPEEVCSFSKKGNEETGVTIGTEGSINLERIEFSEEITKQPKA